MNFQAKITLLIVLLVVAAVGSASFFSYSRGAAALEASLAGTMAGESSSLAASTKNLTEQIRRDALRTSQRPDVEAFFASPANAATVEATCAMLARVCETYPDILRISILDDTGTTVASSIPATIGTNFKTRNYFQNAFAGNVFLAPPFLSAITNRGVIIASAPIRYEGTIRGVLVCTVSLDRYYDTFVKPIRIGQEGFGFVLNASGQVVAHKDASYIFAKDLPDEALYKEIAAAGEGVRDVTDSRGVNLRVQFRTDELSGITMVMQAAYDDVFSGLRSMRNTSILVSCIAVVLAGIVALFSARAMVLPLRAATRFAQAVSAGDFNASIKATSKDEVGTLVSALKYMVGQLKERLGFAQGIMHGIVTPFAVVDVAGRINYMNQQLVQYWGLDGEPEAYYGKPSGEVFLAGADGSTPLDTVLRSRSAILEMPLARTNARGKKLYMSITASPLWDMDGNLLGASLLMVDETGLREQQSRILSLNERITVSVKDAHDISEQQARAFDRLSAQLEKTSEAAMAQDAASEQTMRSITAMSGTLEDLAEKAKQTTEDTRTTRVRAEEGSRIVSQTVDCIARVADHAGRTARGMQALGEQATGINDVVELIKDVADQTNLLALNAAIEAARAGEAGRGFAVVADEVRKLAEKTMQATSQVNSSIQALQSEVAENVRLTDETVELTRTATGLAEQSGESLNSIVTLAEHAAGEVLGIAEATVEQSRTGTAIAGAMENMRAMAGQTTENMRESAAFVEQLSGLSEQLKRLVDSMGSDRRGADRLPLESLYTISLSGKRGVCQCRVLDVSLGGLRLEMQDNRLPQDDGGAEYTITAQQGVLGGLLNGVHGHIVWVDGALCGLEFTDKLAVSSEALGEAVAKIF